MAAIKSPINIVNIGGLYKLNPKFISVIHNSNTFNIQIFESTKAVKLRSEDLLILVSCVTTNYNKCVFYVVNKNIMVATSHGQFNVVPFILVEEK